MEFDYSLLQAFNYYSQSEVKEMVITTSTGKYRFYRFYKDRMKLLPMYGIEVIIDK